MKLVAGVHVNNGPTFNPIAEIDIPDVPPVRETPDGKPIHAVRDADMIMVLSSALKRVARAHGYVATVTISKAEEKL